MMPGAKVKQSTENRQYDPNLSLREFAEKTLENLRKKLRQKVTKNTTKSAE